MFARPACAGVVALLLIACSSPAHGTGQATLPRCGPSSGALPSPPAGAGEAIVPDVSPCPTPGGIPEWRRNLKAVARTVDLLRPVRLVDMQSGATVETIPAGPLDVAWQTTVVGRSFWMTDYSVSHGLPNGIDGGDLEAALLPAAASPTPAPAPTLPPPAGSLPAALRGVEWTRLPTTRKVVALTFDAGSNDAGAARILAALQAAHAPGTFFLTGRWVEIYPGEARTIASTYVVGNHTYSHPSLPGLSDAQVVSEIARGADAIHRVTGSGTLPLFRFPYGARDDRTIALANQQGYGSIRWSVDTLGWEGRSAGQSVDTVMARALGALGAGEIVLMHVGASADGSTLDADALPRLIDAVRARGYELVGVKDFT